MAGTARSSRLAGWGAAAGLVAVDCKSGSRLSAALGWSFISALPFGREHTTWRILLGPACVARRDEDEKGAKRKYDSTSRGEAAKATRELIINSARAIFLEKGYAATTMPAIAMAAGTALDTVYATVGKKPALFRLLIAMDPQQAGKWGVLGGFGGSMGLSNVACNTTFVPTPVAPLGGLCLPLAAASDPRPSPTQTNGLAYGESTFFLSVDRASNCKICRLLRSMVWS